MSFPYNLTVLGEFVAREAAEDKKERTPYKRKFPATVAEIEARSEKYVMISAALPNQKAYERPAEFAAVLEVKTAILGKLKNNPVIANQLLEVIEPGAAATKTADRASPILRLKRGFFKEAFPNRRQTVLPNGCMSDSDLLPPDETDSWGVVTLDYQVTDKIAGCQK